jgi:acyl-CoA reductase-like NAD-dependent aldehyde dehydrogenase
MDIKTIIDNQRSFFKSQKTYDISFRIDSLKKLKASIKLQENHIATALYEDLGKSSFESYMTEIGMVYEEINFMITHVRKFAKDRHVLTPIVHFPGRSFRRPSPYGSVLIMSPWNYPFLLSLVPLVDAIAAGNTVVLKPGSYASKTSILLKKIIEETFNRHHVVVILGGREENQALLEQKFDYIFFTGSTNVGRMVMEKAAKHLTPITLELGGKSPTIVGDTADLKMAARRIIFGKLINCGQTCIAPDYVIVAHSIKDEFIRLLIEEIKSQYGEQPLTNANYGKIINEKHFIRLTNLLVNQKVIFGGQHNKKTMQIEPTIVDEVTLDSPLMKEELFGPILPILTYKTIEDIFNIVNENPTPLALYLFTKNKVMEKKIISTIQFGGGCINDTIIHIATTKMPFGGVGTSGMGSYHGKQGFDTFSHFKSIMKKGYLFDLIIRYQPYTRFKEKIVRKFMK